MAGRIAPKVITNGLIMCLDATNIKSYVSGSTTWSDVSGNDRNGILINGPTFNSSNFGGIVFDGVDDSVRFRNSYGRTLGGSDWFPMSTSAFTFDTWVKTTGLPSGGLLNGIISLTFGLNLYVTSSGRVQMLVWDKALSAITYTTTTVGTNIYDGNWYHIVASNNSLTSKIYIDGVLNVSTSSPFNGDVTNSWYSSDCVLGYNSNNPTISKFLGSIGVFRMYNRALSDEEVLQNYNVIKKRYLT